MDEPSVLDFTQSILMDDSSLFETHQPNPFSNISIPLKTVDEYHYHYRGVQQRPSGKFAAEIRDPNKIGAKLWLGTYDAALEAANAYDTTAFKLRGRKTILNFPLTFVNSTAEVPAVKSNGRKRVAPVVSKEDGDDDQRRKEQKVEVVDGVMTAGSVMPLTISDWTGVWDVSDGDGKGKGLFELPRLSP